MQRVTNAHLFHPNNDTLRNICYSALNLQMVYMLHNNAAFMRAFGCALQLERNRYLNRLAYINSHQVHMDNVSAQIVILNIFNNHLLRLFTSRRNTLFYTSRPNNLHIHQPTTVMQHFDQIMRIQRNSHRFLLVPIHNCRYPALLAHLRRTL